MRVLLDTSFFLWIVRSSPRLGEFPWVHAYQPWGLSPVTFLEVKYLAEVGRLEVADGFANRVLDDPRFEVDDISVLPLIRHALQLEWTRDPFDRLLAAHSSARRTPLCTTDDTIRRNHRFLPKELAL